MEQKDEISKGVAAYINNTPENAPDLKDVSSSVQAWLKDKENPQGKPLMPKKDEGPVRINGELTGKTI